LVAAFLLLGSARVEPLDFWWGPFKPALAAAYLIIITGGLFITARLRLLAMAASFWVGLAVGLGALAAYGHCITARWSLTPVCDQSFWWVVMTSPELLVFLFFMITDPKTIPSGPRARIGFSLALALVCTILIAPQTTEFGAKVGLLAGLVVMTPLRHMLDRTAQLRLTVRSPLGLVGRGAALGMAAVFIGAGTIAAGAPARVPLTNPPEFGTSPTVTVAVDVSDLPQVEVGEEVRALNSELLDVDFDDLAVTMVEALEVENLAVQTGDSSILPAAVGGGRLVEAQQRVDDAVSTGTIVTYRYSFTSLVVAVVYLDGPQGGPALGLEARGTIAEITDSNTYDETRSGPLAQTFVLRPGPGERWLLIEVLPLD
jgi:hypothetical protein